MVSRVYLSFFLVLPLLGVAGCSSFREPPGVTYAKSVTQLGITPVYPPREDMQVGDLYAVEEHADDRTKARTGYIDTIDLTAEIRDYLLTRYKFRDTNTSTGPITASVLVTNQLSQQDALGTGKVPTPTDLATLPITSFPEIEVDSGITVGVAGQPQGLAAVFGFEAAKTLKMSLRFGQVTSYEVPEISAARRLDLYCDPNAPTTGNCRVKNLNYVVNLKYGLLGAGETEAVKGSYIMMISKVYLARQITYTFDDAALAAAAAASQSKGATATIPTVNPAAINKAAADGNAALVSALADLQTALNANVAKQTSEGFGVSFAGYSRNAVSFNEVFARPVVIGFEAVTLAGTK